MRDPQDHFPLPSSRQPDRQEWPTMAETQDAPDGKKPELVAMVPGSGITVEFMETLILRLTGKPMSADCRKRAEDVAAKYAKPPKQE